MDHCDLIVSGPYYWLLVPLLPPALAAIALTWIAIAAHRIAKVAEDLRRRLTRSEAGYEDSS
jgi:hypothetical protein